ncbi:phosphoglycerate kinase, partial [Candidatus Microgenomates bacterium]|nr:phosphoglycerate kinase [Candidatus Microgenomates bacterium]
TLVNDFLTDSPDIFNNQTTKEILVLENIRFYPQEKQNDPAFTKRLSALADVYVNDAFAMAHRTESSVVGVPGILPAYGGLLLKKELKMISQVVQNPKKPVVIILGGSKISSKINLISKLLTIGDYLLIGGGIANTFLAAQNIEVGESIYEYDEKENARRLMYEASQRGTQILLPTDAICGNKDDIDSPGTVKKVGDVLRTDSILDIGPMTQTAWGEVIEQANTIIWNGPVGYFENAEYRMGTDFIYSAITHNDHCMSVVGGGDTLTAISKKEYIEKITHISTGGGAMLEFIEKGTLPGIEALQLKHDS